MSQTKIHGIEEMYLAFSQFPKTVQKKYLRRGVRKAARLIAKSAGQNLQRHKDTGITAKSVVVQVRKSRNKMAVTMSVGITNRRWNFRRISVKTQRPIKGQIPPSVKARLIEYGFVRQNGKHVGADSWLRSAFDAEGQAALQAMIRDWAEGIAQAAKEMPKARRVA